MTGATGAAGAANVPLLLALGASIVLGTFGYVLLGPFFPEVADDLDTTVPLLGQVSAARMLLGAALGLVAGPLADGFGHRRVMAVGLVAAGLTIVGIGTAPGFPALAATAVPGAIGGATLTGLSLAVAGSAFDGAARRRALGWVVGAQAISSIVGVPILVALGGRTGWRPVFLAAGVAALAAIPFIVRALPAADRPQRPASREIVRWSAMVAAYRPFLTHGPAQRLFAVTGLRAIAWGGLTTYFGAFFKEEAELSDGWVGVVFLLAGAGFLLGSVAAGGRLALLPPRALAATGDVLTALLIGALFAAPVPVAVAVAAAALAAFAGAFAYVGVTTLLAVAAPAGAGTTMTLNGSLFGLGSAGGGALGGALLATGGYAALGLGLPAFMLLAAWLVLRPGPAAQAAAARGEVAAPAPARDAAA